ncbi:MAG: carboxylesterase family protein, partial [Pseudomonadota bacterium]
YKDGLIHVFKGIPYGADTSTTRFRAPAAPQAWSGERDATKYGAQSPQIYGNPPDAWLFTSWANPQKESEDCLFVNVWTPGVRDTKRRPVMVWIHGGGFGAGSGSDHGYDGTRLATRGDVVVVTVNHRLNVFGYLYLGQFGSQFADSGNAGQLDLIAALHWVRDNIAEFGGDPDNVLIFGESGGGAKICTLMAMPAAKGLFHRAVVQSGPMIWCTPTDRASRTARQALGTLGITAQNLQALKSVSTAQLLQALAGLNELGTAGTLAPVVDGRNLPSHPFDPVASAVSAHVPLLIGFNHTETTTILAVRDNFNISWQELPARIKPNIGDLDAQLVVDQFRRANPGASPSDLYFEVTTLAMMTRSVLRVADAKSAQHAAQLWMYEVTWETPVNGARWGSPHAFEIGLVFDNVAKSESLYGRNNPEAQKVADQMSEAWIAFARHGNPGTPVLPKWPAYEPKQRPVMQFNVVSGVANNPMGPGIEILKNAPYWDLTK